MEFRILGPLEAVEEGEIVSLPGGRARAVLALLILNAGQAVSTDRLVDALWGGQPPPTATTALQGLVSKLRKCLEPDRAERQTPTLIATRGPGYVLAIDDSQVDASRFRRLLDEAMTLSAEKKASRLRVALGLWRGTALADFTYEPFAQVEITALEGARITALEERIDADLDLGRHIEVIGELEVLVSEHPLRERLCGQLMLSLYRAGRQAEALDLFHRLRRTLAEELGIEPGPALQGLETAILRQDPSLEVGGPSRQPGTIPDETRGGSWLPPGRKAVSVVFVDLAPTQADVEWDAEARRRTMARGYELVTEALERHGGTVQGFLGDVVVAVFGLPAAHENDAWRAVRAATELRRDLVELNDELRRQEAAGLTARVGIETGEVVVGRPGTRGPPASGDAVSIAARLQQAAGAEEILVGERTRRLLGDAAQLEPARAPELNVRAWRLVDRVLHAPGTQDSHDAPMVGRGAELSRLRSLLDQTVRDDEPTLLTVLGEAGIGKSRLAAEFASTIESESLVLTGHCPPYGQGVTFAPLREVVLQAVDDSEADDIAGLLGGEGEAESTAMQVAGAIGLTDRASDPRGAFPALRRFFEVLARRRPTVLVFEDLHWARSTLLDLVDYLAESIQGPVMLLCLARSESPDQRLPGTDRRGDVRSLVLAPLEAEESERLITDRLVGWSLPGEMMDWIRETAQGNPLFIEQLVAALHEEPQLAIPPSLQSLLAARLDRLGPAERDLLRCASVVGVDFSLEVLTALVPTEAGPFLERHLAALRSKELIRPVSGRFPGEPAFAFRHVLIRESAYRSIGRLVRSQLHERVARWLETERTEAADRHQIIGYHLEQAYEERRHLGLEDEHTQTLALEAGERLAGAGLRAFAKFDAAAAEDLLSRATLLLPPTHRQEVQVNRRLAEAHTVMGRHRKADSVLAEVAEKTEGNDGLERFVRIERARIRLAIGPDPTSLSELRDEATLMLEASEQAGDQAGMAQAFFLLALIHLRSGELEAMEKVARQGLACADRSGSAREELGARLMLALALEVGPTPVEACIGALEELVVWRDTEHPLLLSTLGHLQAMLGSFDEARRLVGRARRLLREQTRARRPLGLVHQQSAQVELLAGEVTAAQRGLRAALDLYRDMGEPDPLAQIAGSLSRVLSVRGDHREAAEVASLSRDRAPLESVAAQALWRVATARVVTRRDPEVAERLARQAAGLVSDEMPNLAADLRLELAAILGAAGQVQAVGSLVEEATVLYEGKGNLVGVARAEASRT